MEVLTKKLSTIANVVCRRMQSGTKEAERTILDNTDQVGNNCLMYMEQGRILEKM